MDQKKSANAGGPLSFLKEAWEERKDVTWPSRAEVISLTIVVLVTTVMIAAFLGGVDLALNLIIKSLIETFS